MLDIIVFGIISPARADMINQFMDGPGIQRMEKCMEVFKVCIIALSLLETN